METFQTVSNTLKDLRIKISDILDEKLSDETEIRKTSLYQTLKAYGLLVDKEWTLVKGGYLNQNSNNKLEIILKKE